MFPRLRVGAKRPAKLFRWMPWPQAVREQYFWLRRTKLLLNLWPQLLKMRWHARGGLEWCVPLPHPETFAQWYKLPAPPRELAEEAVYGLRNFTPISCPARRLVANPGCYPTSVILGLRPLVEESGWIAKERGIVCDCKSGASGAGKEPKRELHFVEVDEKFARLRAIFAPAHAGSNRSSGHRRRRHCFHDRTYSPSLAAFSQRSTSGCRKPHTEAEIETLFRKFYADRSMMRLWPAGKLPELQHVANTNFLRHRICARSRGAAASR